MIWIVCLQTTGQALCLCVYTAIVKLEYISNRKPSKY